MDGIFKHVEELWGNDLGSQASLYLPKLLKQALPVLPERLAVPANAGTVRLEDILREPKRSEFLDLSGRVNPFLWLK